MPRPQRPTQRSRKTTSARFTCSGEQPINKAFASRVTSPATGVQNLNYSQSTDLSPFGGTEPPATSGIDPTSWPLLSVLKPDFQISPPVGQARAGTPYACKGNCNNLVC